MFPCLHVHKANLDHRLSKILKKLFLVRRVEIHKRLRPLVRHQSLVRAQQAQPSLQVAEIHVVKFARGHDVVEGRHAGVTCVICAEVLQPLREIGVEGRVDVGGLAEIEDPVAELLAVGEAYGVGPGEDDQVLYGELLGGEEVDDLGDGHVGLGVVAVDSVGSGHEAVLAAEADPVVGPADHVDEVTGGRGDDVCAGDDAGALELEGGLDAGNGVEAVAGEVNVGVMVALRLVEGVGGDEEGGVAAFQHAVVEEEAEDGGGRCRGRNLLVGHDLLDDVVEFGACFFVVVFGEMGICCGVEE